VLLIDQQYYQFIIGTFSPTAKYTLISMQTVDQQQAASVNQFSQMMPIDLTDDLHALVMKSLPPSRPNITLKSISEISLRLQPDGLYYQTVIQTGSDNSYLLTIYSKPEHNFS
jgi:hypothetical protein